MFYLGPISTNSLFVEVVETIKKDKNTEIIEELEEDWLIYIDSLLGVKEILFIILLFFIWIYQYNMGSKLKYTWQYLMSAPSADSK